MPSCLAQMSASSRHSAGLSYAICAWTRVESPPIKISSRARARRTTVDPGSARRPRRACNIHNAENGFCVLRAKARGHRDLVTVVGHAAVISAGEWITASGEWINDRAYGQQFKARFLKPQRRRRSRGSRNTSAPA